MCKKYWLSLVQALLCELETDMIVAADLDVKQQKNKTKNNKKNKTKSKH